MSTVIFFSSDFSTILVPGWSSVDGPTISATAARTGIQGIQGGGNGLLNYAIANNGLHPTYIVGLAVKNPTTNTKVVFMNNAFAVTQHTIQFNDTTRSIQQFNGSAGAVSNGPPNAYDPTVWNYFEFKITAGLTTNGSIDVHINGAAYTQWTGITTINNATYTQFDGIRFVATSTNHKLDDIYILNASGTLNNTFLGDSRIDVLVPTASGTYTQLVPFGLSTNWANVDEIPPNTSDYNYSDTQDAQDSYNFADLAASVSGIAAVQSQIYAAKTATGSRSIAHLCVSSGVVASGTDQALSQSFTYYTKLWETDPGSGGLWTASGLNNAEFGVRIRP